ncbi:MAG: DUF3857 and transglutaminase domain-containing protein [bacterium]|nr:MAG: DUF3857 and transglutaminase domain-containing protein [bacterium]
MISPKWIVCWIFFVVLMPNFLFTQEKWGKVSKEILAMSVFDNDTSAAAVVLFDVAKQEIKNDFTLNMNRHKRIKILTEEGKEAADIKIPFYRTNKITDIKAQTILPNGKKIKLDNDNIFEETLNRYWKQKVFAVPGVEVGAVIEYQYQLHSENIWILEPWYFQNQDYTLLSQFSIAIDSHFNYHVFYQNMVGNQTVPFEEVFLIPGNGRTRKGKLFTWKIEHIAALEKEPFMRSFDDYRMAMFFQLIEYRDPYVYYRFIKEWKDLAKTVYEDYEEHLDENATLRDKVAELISDTLHESEKVKLIYDFVRDEIETEWIYTIWPSKSPKDVLKDKKGKLAEKNMLLISMLRRAGIEAHPMLIGTRQYGRVRTNWPQLQQFNHIIAFTEIEAEKYYLDTCEKCCPFGELPTRDIVGSGFLILPENSDFHTIPAPRNINMVACQTDGEINDDGSLVCTVSIRYDGYQAMEKRKKLATEEKKEYYQEWIAESFAEAVLDSLDIKNFEEVELPLYVSMTFRVANFAQVVDDFIYFSPPQLTRLNKNPFKSEKRSFPVEFTYLSGLNEDVNLKLPEGFEVDEIPPFQIMKVDGFHFLSDSKADGENLNFRRQYLIKKPIFYPNEYPQLRDLHAQIISFEENQVVLKKSE